MRVGGMVGAAVMAGINRRRSGRCKTRLRNDINLNMRNTTGFTLALDDHLADSHEDIHKVPKTKNASATK